MVISPSSYHGYKVKWDICHVSIKRRGFSTLVFIKIILLYEIQCEVYSVVAVLLVHYLISLYPVITTAHMIT